MQEKRALFEKENVLIKKSLVKIYFTTRHLSHFIRAIVLHTVCVLCLFHSIFITNPTKTV